MEKNMQSFYERIRAIAKEKDTMPASQHYKAAFWSAIITTGLYALDAILIPAGIIIWGICTIGVWAAYYALITLDSYVGDVIALLLGYLFGKLLFYYSIFCLIRRYRHNKYLTKQD